MSTISAVVFWKRARSSIAAERATRNLLSIWRLPIVIVNISYTCTYTPMAKCRYNNTLLLLFGEYLYNMANADGLMGWWWLSWKGTRHPGRCWASVIGWVIDGRRSLASFHVQKQRSIFHTFGLNAYGVLFSVYASRQ